MGELVRLEGRKKKKIKKIKKKNTQKKKFTNNEPFPKTETR